MAVNATFFAAQAFAIVPSTNAVTKFTSYGFYVGTGGDVNVVDSRGNTVLFKTVGTGREIRGVIISSVRATNTTATHIVGYGPE